MISVVVVEFFRSPMLLLGQW